MAGAKMKKDRRLIEPFFIIWPERYWEKTSGGWVSRPVTEQDRKDRRKVEEELRAI